MCSPFYRWARVNRFIDELWRPWNVSTLCIVQSRCLPFAQSRCASWTVAIRLKLVGNAHYTSRVELRTWVRSLMSAAWDKNYWDHAVADQPEVLFGELPQRRVRPLSQFLHQLVTVSRCFLSTLGWCLARGAPISVLSILHHQQRHFACTSYSIETRHHLDPINK